MFSKPWARALAIFGHSTQDEDAFPARDEDAFQAVAPKADEIEALDLDLASPAEAFEILRRSVMAGNAGELPVPVVRDRTPPHLRHVAAGVEGSLSVYRYEEVAPAPRKSARARTVNRAT